MIHLKNITKYYVVQGKKKIVLQNLSLEFAPGVSVGILGPNGAGKSTLLRIITGTELPNKGTVTRTSSVSWPIGTLGSFQEYLTGKENIQFICRLYSNSTREMKEKIAFVFDFSELGEYFNMPVQTYSLGMRTRLGFAVSMAFDFDFYIVDELLSAGDITFRKKCESIFKLKIKTGAVIMVSHEMETLRNFCQKGLYLNHNQVIVTDDIEHAIKYYENPNSN